MFAKELAIVENHIKDCSLSGTCEESAKELTEAVCDSMNKTIVVDVNELKEEIKKEIEGSNMKIVIEEKVTTTTVTEDNESTESKKEDSVFTLENTLYTVGGVAVAGAVGFGAYWAYNKFFGGNDNDDIELSEFSAF